MNGDLPGWAITIISLAGSTAITTIVGLIIRYYFKKYLGKKEEQESESKKRDLELAKFYEEEKRQQQKADIAESVAAAIKPLDEKINRIEIVLTQDKAATITNIRSTLKSLRDRYMVQGFADIGDKATWEELYEDYKQMGGNHFKEYVDSWRVDVQNLPKKDPKLEKKD